MNISDAPIDNVVCLLVGRPVEVLIDADDFHRLHHTKWFLSRFARTGRGDYYYVASKADGGTRLLHREIMNPGRNMVVDHINDNRLDNRRSNLRVCTHAVNMGNRHYTPLPFIPPPNPRICKPKRLKRRHNIQFPHDKLADSEVSVFAGIAMGLGLSEIAECSGTSVKTISTYRVRVLAKLGVKNNAEIVRYAYGKGLFQR